jgi:hypothetical protein
MKNFLLIFLCFFLASVLALAQQPGQPPGAGRLAPAPGPLPLPPPTDPGAQKAGELLQQMVNALGGDAYLALQDMQQEGRTYRFHHGESAGTGAVYWRFWQWPDKLRIELLKQHDWIILYVGDQGTETTYHGTSAVEKEQLDDYLRRRNHSLPWVLRKWLKEPGVALLNEGPGVAERKQADRVSIVTAQNDSATIWIDSFTHLPLRISFGFRDPQYRDRVEEAEGYDNYRPVQGIMTPFSIMLYTNDEPVNQRFVTKVKYNQNLPSSMFELPKLTEKKK